MVASVVNGILSRPFQFYCNWAEKIHHFPRYFCVLEATVHKKKKKASVRFLSEIIHITNFPFAYCLAALLVQVFQPFFGVGTRKIIICFCEQFLMFMDILRKISRNVIFGSVEGLLISDALDEDHFFSNSYMLSTA